MDRDALLAATYAIGALAVGPPSRRLLARPGRYLTAIGHRELVYRATKRPLSVRARTAFGDDMRLLLPASTDVYLTGGKSHESELRLARLLIRELRPGDTFVDVGAHYGYFSLLAARLVGDGGHVFAFEAAPSTHAVLADNARARQTIEVVHAAASDRPGRLTFNEFPTYYSEYNTFDVSQFEGQAWFAANPPRRLEVDAVTLDGVLAKSETRDSKAPTAAPASVIKIDVEGAEALVVRGATDYLETHAPVVVMEYLSPARGNASHREAATVLRELGYYPRAIGSSGNLVLMDVDGIEPYLAARGADSVNIAFVKRA